MIGVKRIDSLGASLLAAFVFSLLGAAIADSEGYIGCYKDSRARLLERTAKASRNAMTPALCRQQCDGYAYFGMENHKECFCGNSLNHPEKNVQVPDSDCNRPCTGDKQMMCGGGWRLSVYGMPVDGGLGAWSAWGACSATCGGGQRSRARTCDNPAPSNGGSDCAGDAAQQEGCSSESCPELRNLALRKPAEQSSTRLWGGKKRLSADLAVDGNRDTNLNKVTSSCTHTHEATGQWWRVDLQGQHSVHAVTITNRGDCCGDRLRNFVISVDVNATIPGSGHRCLKVERIAQGATVKYECQEPISGRYVTVYNPSGILQLCEVEVLGYSN